MTKEENVWQNLGSECSNLNCIETNLWLGNLIAASNKHVLDENEIKFILTVNSFPLPKIIAELSHIKTKYIEVYDTPRDDLLSYFDETYEFIESGLKKGAVLVHCYFGVSRSATIIMSYLMKKKNMTMKDAFNYVKSKRKSVGPNPGFLEQLKLYEIMEWKINKNNVQYKMFRLFVAIDHVKKANVVPECCADVIKADPLLATVTSDSTVFKCKKCRRILAQSSNLIPHIPKENYSWRDGRCSLEDSEKSEICHLAYFIEPLAWMDNVSGFVAGKLHCPNLTCRNKLGSFNWVLGLQCPCGTQVCPAFCLIPSKVDKQNIVKKCQEKKANTDDFIHL